MTSKDQIRNSAFLEYFLEEEGKLSRLVCGITPESLTNSGVIVGCRIRRVCTLTSDSLFNMITLLDATGTFQLVRASKLLS